MNTYSLIIRNIIYHRWRCIALWATAIVSMAVIVGAMLVGDTVKATLAQMADMRLGNIEYALIGGEKTFTVSLADKLNGKDGLYSSVLMTDGYCETDSQSGQIKLLGIDDKFLSLGDDTSIKLNDDEAVINVKLADKLKIKIGDDIFLRVNRPAAMSMESPFAIGPESKLSDWTVGFRITVKDILTAQQFGNFQLSNNQITPNNIMVNLNFLQEQLELPDRCNLIVTDSKTDHSDFIQQNLSLADMGLNLKELTSGQRQIKSDGIFIDNSIIDAIDQSKIEYETALTYLVNSLTVGDKTCPYSMVSGINKYDINDQQMVINRWLADDLQANVGDKITIKYYVIDDSRKLKVQSADFKIAKIIEMQGDAIDSDLMPDFKGFQTDNCTDWDPGVTIDMGDIREKDEKYWDNYRGTPKAFITLKAAQTIWANRFGTITTIRFNDQIDAKQLEAMLVDTQKTFKLTPVKKLANNAVNNSMDFGGLFIGLSMFVIFAAMLLTNIVFTLNADKRHQEFGLLWSMGFATAQVRAIILLEVFIIILLAMPFGIVGGILYTKTMLTGLQGQWATATGGIDLELAINFSTIMTALAISIICLLLAVWRKINKIAKQQLKETIDATNSTSKNLKRKRIALILTGIGIIIIGLLACLKASPMIYMATAGAWLLTLTSLTALLFIPRSKIKLSQTIFQLSLRNSQIQVGRSISLIIMLAIAVFMVIAVGAYRLTVPKDIANRQSGTGGFAYIGQTSIPIYHDLNSPEAKKVYGFESKLNDIVMMRVKPGDMADCLNLNRPQRPMILAVQPEQLAKRSAFEFVDKKQNWTLIQAGDDYTIPAIADYGTLMWALGKKVGDTITVTDDNGDTIKIEFVGALKGSTLQGAIIIAQDQFLKHFSNIAGFNMLLIDASSQQEKTKAKLQASLLELGLNITDSKTRLTELLAVENTYRAIFQLLSTLGILLGGLGLAILTICNVIDRKRQLLIMRACGFNKPQLRIMLITELGTIIIAGIAIGLISGLIAILPGQPHQMAMDSFKDSLITVSAIMANCLFWVILASFIAPMKLQGQQLQS
ncbi:MAG: ABC transporter permease [Phycisphaerae bacterium]|nr:ABC transporter permease [Phycisphaerae bacterium]